MSDRAILLVEDDPVLRTVGKRQLSAIGFSNVKIAETGELALEFCLQEQPSLIFMDIGLPGMDGIEVTAAIRARELQANALRVPIVALTAHSDRQRCLEAGMDDFLQKPALIDDLKRVTSKWLG